MIKCLHQRNNKIKTNRRIDPTRTYVLRKTFEAQMFRRFTALKGRINEAIIEKNGFGFNANDREFAFPRDSQKVAAFMEWLNQQAQIGVLGIRVGTPIERAAENAWTRIYIDSAYKRAIEQAGQDLRKQGVQVAGTWTANAFFRPIHADAAGLAYTRAFRELKGVTDEMDKQISRVLTQGIIDGMGSRAIAKQINDRVDSIGLTRARMLARTEIVRAHSEATLNAYEEAGAEGVIADVEFSTAGDNAVCPECESLEGKEFTIDESRGIIPVHPNCRCAWKSIIYNPKGIRLN